VVQADLWTWRPGLGWSSLRLDPRGAPALARAAAFSPADLHLWVLDEQGPGRYRLLRVDPTTGAISHDAPLAEADGLTQVWLTTLEDGRVLLAGDDGANHRLAILEAIGTRVQVAGRKLGARPLLTQPGVRSGKITMAFEGPRGERGDQVGVDSEHVAVEELR
jgi:hypothetical protein